MRLTALMAVLLLSCGPMTVGDFVNSFADKECAKCLEKAADRIACVVDTKKQICATHDCAAVAPNQQAAQQCLSDLDRYLCLRLPPSCTAPAVPTSP